MRKEFRLLLLTSLLITGFSQQLLSQEKIYRGIIPDANHIPPLTFTENSTPLVIQDPVYADPALQPLIGNVKKMQNVVMLRINEESLTYIPSNFIVDVPLEIIKTPIQGGTPVTVQKTLHLDYKLGMGQKSDAASYYVDDIGGYILSVQIKSPIQKNVTWDVIPLLQVIAEIHAEYDAPFDFNSPVNGLSNLIPSTSPFDEVEIVWSYPGNQAGTFNSFPTDYDIEWAWIDASAEDAYKTSGLWDAEKIFFNNATRVTVPVTVNSYKIPSFYDGSGWIFYRVRSVQKKTNGQVINGNWTTNISSNAGYYNMTEGHEEGLNWQVSTTYAEDGKRKTVIQYFDGTLRGRQTVTKDNSQPTPTTVVAETFYDYQGRPTIQVLPAPTLNNVIRFVKNFNNNANNGDGYPKEIFDLLQSGQTACGTGAPALENIVRPNYSDGTLGANGAGNYYSSLNPLVNNGFNKFIPDANGFAFTETRYTQDATGRVLAQGGVGQAFQLGAGHETKYFYSAPMQEELDILFGTDAGIAGHYEKNLVKDANGQFSVSYVDMHGRTVATALAGDKPESVEALKSLQDLPNYDINTAPAHQLLTEETNVVVGRSIVMVKDFVVTTAGVSRFKYRLDPKQLELTKCPPEQTPICYDCLYDLKITITNSCTNAEIFSLTRSNFTLPHTNVCGTEPAEISEDFDVNFTETGSYTITKTLTLSKEAQDEFLQHAMQYGNLVCETEQTIHDQIEDVMLLQNQNCHPTCESCLQNLGSETDFITKFRNDNGLTPFQVLAYLTALKKAYEQAKADCDAICENGSDRVNNYEEIMLLDMMPDRGQYARILRDDLVDANGNPLPPVNITQRPFNIFGEGTYKLPKDDQAPVDRYKDEYGIVDVNAQVNLSGWSEQEFTENFKESWAKQLLSYHPEYKKLKIIKSDAFKTAYAWQEKWQNKEKWSDVTSIVTGAGLPANDPLSSAIPSFQSTMAGKMAACITIKSSDYPPYFPPTFTAGMWQFAVASVKCKNQPENLQVSCIQNTSNTIGVFPSEIDCDPEKDMVWRVFSGLYFREREIIIFNHLQNVAYVDPSLFNVHPNTAFIQYQARFIDPAGGIQTYLPAELTAAYNAAQSGDGPAAQAQLEAQYEDNCRSYAVQWLEQVHVFDDCTNNDIGVDAYNILIEQLVAICKAGSDLSHPLGSSSVPPGNTTSPGTFEEALANFMAAYSVTLSETCHPYIINWPKPYDKSHMMDDEEVWETTADDCICERWDEINTLYYNAISGTPAFTGTLLDFLRIRMGTVITQATIDKLQIKCAVEEHTTCDYFEEPIILPPALQCGSSNEICISCSEYEAYKKMFLEAFSTAIPAGINIPVMSPASELEATWNNVFAQYMNYKTGFQKQWHEYANFDKGCVFTTEPVTMPNGICARLEIYIQTFNSIYQTLDDGSTDCQTLFTNYFNEQEGTNFTYQQIKWIYSRCHENSCVEIPVYCGAQSMAGKIINNMDVYVVKLDASGNSANCAANTNDLTVQAPDYTTLSSGIEFINDVTLNPLVISVNTVSNNPDTSTHCTNGAELYQKTYGGNNNDVANKVTPASGGGYVVAGQTQSYGSGGDDGLLMKITENGQVSWSKAIGGSGNDVLFMVRPTSDNGFIACGQTKSFGNSAGDAWLVKINSSGTVEWSKKYGDGNIYGDAAFDVIQMSDGGYAFCGSHRFAPLHAQSFVVRTDNNGNIIWSKEYGINSNSDGAMGLVEDQGNIVVVGYHQSTDNPAKLSGDTTSNSLIETGSSYYDSYLMKLNTSNGTINYKQGYDAENRSTWFRNIAVTTEGYQVLSAVMNDYIGTNSQEIIWNIYANGTVHNARKLVIPGIRTKSFAWLPQADGGFIAANGENNANSDAIYCKVNASGTLDWSKKIAFEGDQVIYGITTAPNSGYAAAGFTNSRTEATPPCGDPLPTYLCGLNLPINQEFEIEPDDPCDDIYQLIDNASVEAWNIYLQKIKDNFNKEYENKCLAVQQIESFTVQSPGEKEYHYTLYYYDQAGGLVQTIPPAGVDDFNNNITTRSNFLAAVKTARQNGAVERPNHRLPTVYRYNTLGQVAEQKSPDGGLSKFWYDELGRLVVSQNAKQANPANSPEGNNTKRYSYTLYDVLGRISQVGQKPTNAAISQAITRDKTELQNWLNNGGYAKEQITRTVYDVSYINGNNDLGTLLVQQNLRNRVSYSQVVATEPSNPNDPASWAGVHGSATYYTYDIHGNVDELLQDFNEGPMKEVNGGANRFKKIAYTYDLISGKVNTVTYQPDYYIGGNDVLQHHIDRFYHRYDYDAQNKLIMAETSHDGIIWETDARYSYYKHGPLARMVLGQQQVQGVDYAYTLQGWLKGVNSTAISAAPTEDCAPGTGRDILDVFNRQQYAHPPLYTARQEINFFPEFESDMPDDFVAEPNPSLQPCIPVTPPTPYITGDMGRDGKPETGNSNRYTARDAYSFSLNYYTATINAQTVNDYQSINTNEQPFTNAGMFNVLNNDDPTPKTVARPLFNGNIASMFVNIPSLYTRPDGQVSTVGGAQLYGYQYDQLHRIVTMDAFAGFQPDINGWLNGTPTATNNYKERISYDPNGNILTYFRNGALNPPLGGGGASPLQMDNLTYQYPKDINGKLLNNRLRYVHDQVADINYAEDIDNQTTLSLAQVQAETLPEQAYDNYVYDEIGNLISDVKEGITKIEWTVYGKIKAIYKKDFSNIEYIAVEYKYDAGGNRIQKTVYPADRGISRTTVYARDASGNVMAIYESGNNAVNSGQLTQAEVHKYGSSRLGVYTVNRNVENYTAPGSSGTYTFTRGNAVYELNNHLGNVLVTISDRKLQVSAGGTAVEYYTADVVTAVDYYPFGMAMPGRTYSSDEYRYGFNGKEKDKDIAADDYDFGARIYDGRIAKWLSVDPLQKKYPGESPYHYTGGNPILYKDPDGRDRIITHYTTIELGNGIPPLELMTTKVIKGEYMIHKGDDGKYYYYDIIQTTRETISYDAFRNGSNAGTYVSGNYRGVLDVDLDEIDTRTIWGKISKDLLIRKLHKQTEEPTYKKKGGIRFTTSKGGAAGDKYDPSWADADSENIDLLISAIKGMAITDLGVAHLPSQFPEAAQRILGILDNIQKISFGMSTIEKWIKETTGLIKSNEDKTNIAAECLGCLKVYRDSSGIWVPTNKPATHVMRDSIHSAKPAETVVDKKEKKNE